MNFFEKARAAIYNAAFTESVGINNSRFNVNSTEPLLEISKGNVPGHSILNYQASNQGVGAVGTEQSFWNLSTIYQYLPSDTQLYASSTNAGDTTVTISILGVDDQYVEQSLTVTLNGQSQVALSDLSFRIRRIVVTGSTAPAGDVYIAETDTLTAGVPNTAAKIHMKMDIGTNIANNSTLTVPAGKTFFIGSIITRSGKAQALRIKLRIRGEGGVFAEVADIETFEQQNQVLAGFGGIASKSDIDTHIIPDNVSLRSTYAITWVVVDNDYTALSGTRHLITD